MIDLHCHSTFSDGKLTPIELLQLAVKNNVKKLALTDHDTIDGLLHIQKSSIDYDINIINGIEFSAKWKKFDIHILGLNIDIDSNALKDGILLNKDLRRVRAQNISKLLSKLGIKDAYDKVYQIAGHKDIGRPHFAELLVKEGMVRDFQSAFKQYLGRGRKAYYPSQWLSLEEVVNVINLGKGQAVLAHPCKYQLTRLKLHELIKSFKEAGGMGIEVVSGQMMKHQIDELAGLSNRYGLMASTGSDFHSHVSPVSIGKQAKLPENCQPIWQDW